MCASYSAAAESGRMGMPGWKRHSHRHVAYCVGADGDIVLGGEVEQVLADFFFLFGRTWHLPRSKKHIATIIMARITTFIAVFERLTLQI